MKPRHERWWRVGVYGVAGLVVVGVVGALVLRHYAEPIARRRIVRSVEERLGAPASLDEVQVTFQPGLRITGRGLHVAGVGARPAVEVRSFAFASNLLSLFRARTELVKVEVEGMRIVVPLGVDRAPMGLPPTTHTHGEHGHFLVSEVVATNSDLVVESADPAGYPLTFHLARVVFDGARDGKASHFDALLANPKPLGEIHVHGMLGPCDPQKPLETAVSGRFDFAQGDLSSVNGVRGHVHGQGTLTGSLGLLGVQGEAATADLNVAPGVLVTGLDSEYRATLNTVTGAIALESVAARVLHTNITAKGTITRVPAGHDVVVDTELEGRAEDVLDLVSPERGAALVRAALTDRAQVHLPPGRQRLLLKLEMNGVATLGGVRWGDADVQRQVDALSERAEGRAKEVAADAGAVPLVQSSLANTFVLREGRLEMSRLTYTVPGATVLMEGEYDLPAETLDFHGIVRTAADASHMTTGVKSLLLKPLDPFLRKNGAGMQLPVALTGPKSGMKLGLDLGHRGADDRMAAGKR